MLNIIVIFLCIPATAHAYLDPGTGNALITAIIGIGGVIIFNLKSLFFKLKRKILRLPDIATTEKIKIAFLSEGNRYWPYFKDIVAELMAKKIPFIYYTLDMHDSAFSIIDYADPDFDHSSFKVQFLGKGSKGFAKASHIKEEFILSTTPNIGTKGYPILRSSFTKELIHIFHGIYDIGTYKKGSLDQYDTVFLNGKVQEGSIRKLEQINNLKPKELTVTGSPFIDSMIERSKSLAGKSDGKTVLIASTWDKKGCLNTYGALPAKLLAEAGYNVIIRPHPQSYISELDMINAIKKELSAYPNVEFDAEMDGLRSISRADILISDVSGIRFDYVFCFNRPVITLESPQDGFADYETDFLSYMWENDISAELGTYLNKTEIDKLPEYVEKLLNQDMNKLNLDEICQTGDSKSIISDILLKKTEQ